MVSPDGASFCDEAQLCRGWRAMAVRSFGHLVDNRQVAAASGATLSSHNPVDGNVWAEIARGDAADADRAMRSADRAFREVWGPMEKAERASCLTNLADLLATRWQELVEAEVHDNGKRIVEVRGQFAGLHSWFRPFADAAAKVAPHPLAPTMTGVECTSHKVPYGVVVAITPWNSPLMIAAWKLAPALAAGNTIVLKPSELASASTVLFAELAGEVLPPGVLNVVTGLGAEVGEALVRHPLARKITFTGSERGGAKVAEAAASGPWPVTLELGGKSPQIVFADADPDATFNGLATGIFASNGQSCVAGSRLIIQRTIHDEMVARMKALAARLRPGDPMDPATQIAPLANSAHRDKVLGMIQTAKDQGARCVAGGTWLLQSQYPEGCFVAPTVFTDVAPDMDIWRQEVFGPVLAVAAFDTEDESIALANDSDYGLAAGIWTRDIDKGQRVAAQIEAGTVYINHYRSVDAAVPVGGMKRSGYGRELGPDALEDFQQTKAVWVGHVPLPPPFG